MRHSDLIIPVALILSCAEAHGQSAIPQIVVIGKITQLRADPLKNSKEDWVVKATIEMVEAGDFAEQTLVFRIHSPSKLKIEIGKRYRIRAKKFNGHYSAHGTDIKAIN